MTPSQEIERLKDEIERLRFNNKGLLESCEKHMASNAKLRQSLKDMLHLAKADGWNDKLPTVLEAKEALSSTENSTDLGKESK